MDGGGGGGTGARGGLRAGTPAPSSLTTSLGLVGVECGWAELGGGIRLKTTIGAAVCPCRSAPPSLHGGATWLSWRSRSGWC